MKGKGIYIVTFGAILLLIFGIVYWDSINSPEITKPNRSMDQDQAQAQVQRSETHRKAIEKSKRLSALTREGKIKFFSKKLFKNEKETKIDVTEQPNGGYRIDFEYLDEVVWSEGMFKKSFLLKSMETANKIFNQSAFDDVTIISIKTNLQFQDDYGNESIKQAARLTINKNLATKINFKNIGIDDFKKVVSREGDLWFHQSLR